MEEGYAEDPSFIGEIDLPGLVMALRKLQDAATQQQLHLIFGSCLREDEQWYNAGIYYGPQAEQFIYRKVNLAISERSAFSAGAQLLLVDLRIKDQPIRLGIQLCCEIRFPEQWQFLARAGVQIFAYLTNAVGNASEASVWQSHLISRAAEHQRFVLSANNAHPAQKCPSMIITSKGEVA